jgi:predicted DsbA family dithiol-disulfide isomerase
MATKIDIWTDIACPWCFIGKRRFEKAIAQFDGDLDVEFHSFLLSPDAPIDYPGRHAEWLAAHLGVPPGQAEQMGARVTTLAAEEGLAYDYESIRTTNTTLAHQLIHLAKSHGRQAEMVERLSSAYFEEGRHLGRIDELVDLAQDVGLDAGETRVALTAGTHAKDVEDDIATARRLGIHGVPFFVIDGRLGVSGAQTPEVFLDALRQAAAA